MSERSLPPHVDDRDAALRVGLDPGRPQPDESAALANAQAVVRKHHAALATALQIQRMVMQNLTNSDEALRALHVALNGALQLLDQGQTTQARAVLAVLAAAAPPKVRQFPSVELPALPAALGGES